MEWNTSKPKSSKPGLLCSAPCDWLKSRPLMWVVLGLAFLRGVAAREITGVETWSGRVVLRGDVTITPTGSLTILPGTRIECDARADDQVSGINTSRIEIIVDQGTLTAVGTSSSPIVFTSSPAPPASAAPGDWHGLRLKTRKATLRYCTFEFGSSGVSVEGGELKGVQDCVFQDNALAGLMISADGVSAQRCVFRRNLLGIYDTGADGLAYRPFSIASCEIVENTTGGITTCSGATVSNCRVANNQEHGIAAGGCFGGGQAVLIVSNSEVSRNGLAGITLNDPSGTLRVAGSIIENNNTVGIVLSGASTVTDCTISGNETGLAIQYVLASLDLVGNSLFNRIHNLANLTSEAVVIEGSNYWGEPTTSELKNDVRNLTYIYDSRDDANLGQVLIRKWSESPTGAVIAPTIVLQPKNQTLYAGNDLALNLRVNGSIPLTYQWFKDGNPLATGTAPTLAFTPVGVSDAGRYHVRVSNSAGSAVSEPATVVVKPASEAALLTIGTFAAIGITGKVGGHYAIQYATDPDSSGDWTKWTTLSEITLPISPYVFVDPTSGSKSRRIYRAVLMP